jgi:hypothetical protein
MPDPKSHRVSSMPASRTIPTQGDHPFRSIPTTYSDTPRKVVAFTSESVVAFASERVVAFTSEGVVALGWNMHRKRRKCIYVNRLAHSTDV